MDSARSGRRFAERLSLCAMAVGFVTAAFFVPGRCSSFDVAHGPAAVGDKAELHLPRPSAASAGLDRQFSRREPAAALVRWIVQDEVGARIPGARVAIRGESWGCDAEGSGLASLVVGEETEVPCFAEALSHGRWAGNLLIGQPNTIVLPRTGIVRITVLDDDLVPVDGAEVWLARRQTDGDAIDNDPSLPHGTTDSGGVTQIESVPLGKFILHARHNVLVHSSNRLKQMGVQETSNVVMVRASTSEVTMYMTMPYVCGIDIVGGEIFYDGFRGTNTGYHAPQNLDGAWACRRLKARLGDSFPGARFLVVARDLAPPAFGGRFGDYVVTAWVLGRVDRKSVV